MSSTIPMAMDTCFHTFTTEHGKITRRDIIHLMGEEMWPDCFEAGTYKRRLPRRLQKGIVTVVGTSIHLHFVSEGNTTVGNSEYSYVNEMFRSGKLLKTLRSGTQRQRQATITPLADKLVAKYVDETATHFVFFGAGDGTFAYLGFQSGAVCDETRLRRTKVACFRKLDYSAAIMATFRAKDEDTVEAWDNFACPDAVAVFTYKKKKYSTVRQAVRSRQLKFLATTLGSSTFALDVDVSVDTWKATLAREWPTYETSGFDRERAYRKMYRAKAEGLKKKQRREFRARVSVVAKSNKTVRVMEPKGKKRRREDVDASKGFCRLVKKSRKE